MLDVKKFVVVLLFVYINSINSITCLNDSLEQGQLVFAHVVNEFQVFPCFKITDFSFFSCDYFLMLLMLGVISSYSDMVIGLQLIHIQMTLGESENIGQRVMAN